MKDISEVKMGGWVKDREDPRDFPAVRLVFAEMPLPANYFINPNTPVYNQGSHPACVGYACAGIKSDEEYLQSKKNYLFDGLWLYKECKKIDGIPDADGTYLRCAMEVLQKMGMRQVSLPCKKKNPDTFWEIGAYYRIENDAADDFIKQVIFQHGAIAVGSYWYDSWMSVGEVFDKPEGIDGGHAYRICGWRQEEPAGWVIVNSWGKLLWGKAGIAIMPYDIFRAAVMGTGADIWKLVDK